MGQVWRQTWGIRWAALLLLSSGASCGDYDPKVAPGTRAPSDASASPGADTIASGPEVTGDTWPDGTADSRPSGHDTSEDPIAGGSLFAEHCAQCHGADALGHTAVALRPWRSDRAALVDQIATNMPPFAPERCDMACAERIADWLLTELPPLACDSPTLPAPSLRLLSRRELARTARDLFDADATAECTRVRFSFAPPGQPQAVVVAGSFNGWGATAAAGGWPLTREGARWAGSFEVPNGTWRYKFVVDGASWFADPDNPAREDDGYGGQNSVLTVECRAPRPIVAMGEELTANFPPESRPERFAFDTWHEQTITADHVESWLELASQLADLYVADLPARLPCASAGGQGCASTLIEGLAHRAWRRPITNAERDRLVALVMAEASFADGVRVALRVLLTAPDFLYRSELGVDRGDGVRELTSRELANALSYGLWGTMPDAPLAEKAERDALRDPTVLASEARRLLADPRARNHLATFAVQWLGADKVALAVKNAGLFPGFDTALRQALLDETRRFFVDVVFDGTGRFADLFVADHTFLNEALARHYGVSGISGAELRRVVAPAHRRAGLLAHGSVLATTAHSDQTSPILRGLFVRERLLCQTFGAPPPSAGGLPPVDPSATTRERFRQHTANDLCASCHRYIDDVGFGFEHFDPVGRWRDTDAGQPIDARGDLNDREGFGTGTHAPFSSLPELAAHIAESPTARACFVGQLARHTLGAREADRCALADLEARFEASGGDIRELIVDLVTSPGFRTRRPPPEAP